MVTCALCGFAYDPAAAGPACGACPLSPRCAVTCCPNCGYAAPADAAPRPVRPAAGRPADAAFTLDRLGSSGAGVVAELDPGLPESHALALAALGVMPGARCTVLRTWPACLVRIGARTVALDHELARMVRLEPAA